MNSQYLALAGPGERSDNSEREVINQIEKKGGMSWKPKGKTVSIVGMLTRFDCRLKTCASLLKKWHSFRDRIDSHAAECEESWRAGMVFGRRVDSSPAKPLPPRHKM
jgi:hypothetical protein